MEILRKILIFVLFIIPGVLSQPQPTIIYNPNPYNLTDFQVRIDLSNVYLGAPTYLKVTDANGNILPFCYEQPNGECTNTTPTKVIWVRLNLTANSNTTIYIYQSGINYAVPGDRVFDFYDDFNRVDISDKWYVTGSVSVSGGNVIVGNCQVCTSQITAKNTFQIKDKVIEMIIGWRNDYGWNAHYFVGFKYVTDTFSGDTAGEYRYNVRGIRFEDISNTNTHRGPKLVVYDGANWYFYDVDQPIYVDWKITVKIDDTVAYLIAERLSDGSVFSGQVQTGALNLLANYNFVVRVYDAMAEYAPAYIKIDWIRIRKYADQDPQVVKVSLNIPHVKLNMLQKSETSYRYQIVYRYVIPLRVVSSSLISKSVITIPIILNTKSLIAQGIMKADCSDIYITAYNPITDTEQVLRFYVDSATCNTENTIIYVNIPEYFVGRDIFIDVYFGAPDAIPTNDPTTFYWFVDLSNPSDYNKIQIFY